MSIPCPPVDPRSTSDVVAGTTELVKRYSSWRPRADGPDAGSALIRVLAGMASQVIQRLNQVPDRTFLAFLNLIGVQPDPPRAALAPVTFSLATGAAAATVPAGTLVGAGDVTFATTLDLEMTSAQLTSVFVRQPDGDLYTDATAAALGEGGAPYAVFEGEGFMEHSLYLAADEVLALPLAQDNPAVVTLDLGSSGDVATWDALCQGTVALRSWPYYADHDMAAFQPVVVWEYWDGEGWSDLGAAFTSADSSYEASFSLPEDMTATVVNGLVARWIRLRLRAWPAAEIPPLQAVHVGTKKAISVPQTAAAPDAAFHNGAPVDLTKDVYPFGEAPRYNDTFYLGSRAALSRPASEVTIAVTASSAYTSSHKESNPRLSWEVWTAGGWSVVGTGDMSGAVTDSEGNTGAPGDENPSAFQDETLAFTSGGGTTNSVTFPLPEGLPTLTYQGVESAWLRVRLVSGDYGTGPHLTADDPPVVVNDKPFTPPILEKVTLSATVTPRVSPRCFTCNDLSFVDRTGEAGFVPFELEPGAHPALYLGFDRAFGNRSVVLYVQVAPLSLGGPSKSDLQGASATDTAPLVAWEYFKSTPRGGASSWTPLGAADGTGAFAQSGLVQFVGPADMAPKVEFGESLFWIRARLDGGGYPAPPRAGRVLTNTVFAVNATTTAVEVLGSASTAPLQTFRLSQTPVLAGQRIEVMEHQVPPPDELADLQAEEGADAVTIVAAEDGSPEQVWVRWHAVPSFVTSGPRDRHYEIDSASGTVRFGDGQHGMVPPAGSNNVRAAWYQSGGGAGGNVPTGSIRQLKTSVAYVSGVTNTEAASGGADAESLDHVKDRGPTILRHRGRAVAAQDFEDLARAASPAVARVSAISPWFDPTSPDPSTVNGAGRVLLVLVPEGTDPKPSPGLGLLQQVGDYLRARAAPAVKLVLSGPNWIEVSARDLAVVPASLSGADALAATVEQALTRFLHPLTGGPDGRGWQFGQLPHVSDICRLVEGIDGVDAVLTAQLVFHSSVEDLKIDQTTADNRLAGALVCSGKHHVRILPPASEGFRRRPPSQAPAEPAVRSRDVRQSLPISRRGG